MNEQTQANDDLVQNFYGIFGKSAEDVQTSVNGENGPSVYFNPDSLNAPNKTYSAVVRFLPNIYNPTVGLVNVQKYVVESVDGTSISYKSPKSLDRYAKCPVSAKYWELNSKDQKNPVLKEAGKKIKWSSNTYALIQVVEDDVKPENVGKMFIWNVPKDIRDLIEQQRKPTTAMLKRGIEANNVFDPIYGRNLILEIPVKTVPVNEKSTEVRDYSKCAFDDSGKTTTTIFVKDEKVRRPVPTTPEELADYQKAVIETLTSKEALKLDDYGYKTESEEHTNKVMKAIDDLIAVATGQTAPAQPVQQFTAAPVQSEPIASQPVAAQPVSQQASAMSSAHAQSQEVIGNLFPDKD